MLASLPDSAFFNDVIFPVRDMEVREWRCMIRFYIPSTSYFAVLSPTILLTAFYIITSPGAPAL